MDPHCAFWEDKMCGWGEGGMGGRERMIRKDRAMNLDIMTLVTIRNGYVCAWQTDRCFWSIETSVTCRDML